ncbi:hypothetical protein [Nannocystis pusilla]|uniref:hypothetical protein n=1 Tax=Nannocystis pusilla TaxID=889268 RepID=UPI003BF3B525
MTKKKTTTKKNSSTLDTTTALRDLKQWGTVTLRGVQGLVVARQTLERAMVQAGCEIRFDPSSAPDLIDYLAVATVSGLEAAILGAGIGALLGLLFEQSGTGLAIGAGVGLVAGASRGVRRVQAGWRVQAVRELNGEPRITISAVGST